MNEFNQSIAQNLGEFLFELSDEVVKGLQRYLDL